MTDVEHKTSGGWHKKHKMDLCTNEGSQRQKSKHTLYIAVTTSSPFI